MDDLVNRILERLNKSERNDFMSVVDYQLLLEAANELCRRRSKINELEQKEKDTVSMADDLNYFS